MFVISCYLCDCIVLYFSGSSEDLADCMSAPLTPPTPGPRSPLKSASGTSVSSGIVKRRTRTTSASYTSAGDGPVVRSGTRTIYTAGRPPWYDSQGQLKEAFVIGICLLNFTMTLKVHQELWYKNLHLVLEILLVCG